MNMMQLLIILVDFYFSKKGRTLLNVR